MSPDSRFNLMSANLADNKQNRRRLKSQVLPTLVDEILQMQEAKRLNISVNDSEISDAERILEAQNNMRTGSLKGFLKSRGLDESTLITKIQAEIAWGKVLRRQILSRIDISDEEIDEVFNRLQSRRGTEQNSSPRASDPHCPLGSSPSGSAIRVGNASQP